MNMVSVKLSFYYLKQAKSGYLFFDGKLLQIVCNNALKFKFHINFLNT